MSECSDMDTDTTETLRWPYLWLMSRSQEARVATERWVREHGYCLACESDVLRPTKANTPARDFECER